VWEWPVVDSEWATLDLACEKVWEKLYYGCGTGLRAIKHLLITAAYIITA
jgi:hypothetical protein